MKKHFLLICSFFLVAQISMAQQKMALKKPMSLQDFNKLQELVMKNPTIFSGSVEVNENGAIRTRMVGENLAGKSEDKPKPDPKPDPKAGRAMGNVQLAGKSEDKPKPDPKPDPKKDMSSFQRSPNTVFISQNPDAMLRSQLNRILAPYQ